MPDLIPNSRLTGAKSTCAHMMGENSGAAATSRPLPPSPFHVQSHGVANSSARKHRTPAAFSGRGLPVLISFAALPENPADTTGMNNAP